ncbi:response regulator transcription factor [Roseicyclus mahoneyensis]|nr:response regulator transcription factor [Roseicyclus mahoneyensis]
MVIEDYDALRETMCNVLQQDGHEVCGVAMAEDVDDTPVGFVPDLYIIDLGLPGEDGISLATRIRRSEPSVGIVIVSARNEVTDRIGGYFSGANIYLTKPVYLDELRSVVAGFAQRLVEVERGKEGSFHLHPLRMQVSGPKASTRVTQAEQVLLAAFARAAQQSLEHWQVAAHFGQGEDLSKENLEVKLGRLRKKLLACGAPAPAIQSIRGVGYRLCVPVLVMNE